jgi:hypothetical protein
MRLTLALILSPTAAPALAHEFELLLVAPPEATEAVLGQMRAAFLIASHERDSHPDETSEGHLGGMDVQLTLSRPAMRRLRGWRRRAGPWWWTARILRPCPGGWIRATRRSPSPPASAPRRAMSPDPKPWPLTLAQGWSILPSGHWIRSTTARPCIALFPSLDLQMRSPR